jgi:hypothetical protein
MQPSFSTGRHKILGAAARLANAESHWSNIRLTIAGDVIKGREALYWQHCEEKIAQDPPPIVRRKVAITF